MNLLKRTAANMAAAMGAGAGQMQQDAGYPSRHARLREVATFDHQVTGVAVSRQGRIFVNFPRWTEDSPISVAELGHDGHLTPFPDEDWNAWRNSRRDELAPASHFVCVQSVVMDHADHLWVLDPAAPAQSHLVPGGAKLVKIDLASNRVALTILFDEEVAPQGSYLNDVRFSPDDRYAYITDSGARGALVVVELASGQSWRMLDGHASTQPEKDVQVKADGHVLRRADGRGVEFAADGIALSPDGHWLYWQAIKGRSLYRIPAEVLHNAHLPAESVEKAVERVGENGPADGLLIDRCGRMYISAVEENAIKVREGDRVRTLLADDRLRWPDSFAEGPDGEIYVTSSHIQDMKWFKPGNGPQLPTALFRIEQPQ